MDAGWRIELLGRLRVTHGDREITRFRTQKTRALLGYLAYFPEPPRMIFTSFSLAATYFSSPVG